MFGLRHVQRSALPVLCLGMLGLLGCSTTPTGLTIYDTLQARSQSSRVEFLVLHYTNSNTARSLQTLTQGEVSSHYLVTEGPAPKIYRLVDEDRRAWHAGASAWRGRTWLNASSIGIEIVHQPYTHQPNGSRTWADYDPAQIAAVIALSKDIMQRHGIKAENVVGHSDIAPTRKQDPGPKFPWRELAKQGVGLWYDEDLAQAWLALLQQYQAPPLPWFVPRLRELGYHITPLSLELDNREQHEREAQAALQAFQMRWRAERHDGMPDRESAAVLLSLLEAPLETHTALALPRLQATAWSLN